MKILILGVNGYLGREVSAALVNMNINVTGIDIQSTCYDHRINYIKANLTSRINKSFLFNDEPDVILDLISFIKPDDISSNEKEIDSVLDKYRELIKCYYSRSKYIFISSGGTVYGNSSSVNFESDNLNPISPYAIQKVKQEKIIKNTNFLKHWYILRLSNPYGRSQLVKNGVGFISYAIDTLSKKRNISLTVPRTIVRDYIHIDDVIKYIISFIKNNHRSGVYNLSSNKATKLEDIINEISKILDITCEIDDVDNVNHNSNLITKNVLDNKKIISETGIVPKVELNDGLKELIKGLKNES